jgi:hypothetical protein
MSSSIAQSPSLLLPTTPHEILSWIIDIEIENHLACDSNCNNKIYDPSKSLQGMRNNVGLTFIVGDPILRFRVSIEQDK